MGPFEAFQIYTALKLHFTTDYDYFKYNGKTKASSTRSTFESHKCRWLFEKWAGKFTKPDDFRDFLVANQGNLNRFVYDLNDPQAEEVYFEWRRKIESLTRVFTDDCDDLCRFLANGGHKFSELFDTSKTHPAIMRMVMKHCINVETYIIIDLILSFGSKFDLKLSKDPVYAQFVMKVRKYKPFLQVYVTDTAKFRTILKEKIEKEYPQLI